METADDAGVYKISEEMALVQTLDFITPIVDDPFIFGQIAAANSLSDVYAMGGKPLTAMNIVGFPVATLPLAVLTEILQGGLTKIHEAGAVLLGGHTVDDPELKYGLSVTGTVYPQKIMTNRGAREGDILVLTKGLGTGIIATANKADLAEPGVVKGAMDSMMRLNDRAAEAMGETSARGCTDITGFGLLGHAAEMAKASGLSFRLFYASIPILPGVKECAAQGMIPAGAYCNERYFGREIGFADTVPERERIFLFDPQTSGGLLIALPRREGDKLLRRLQEKGIREAAIIGEVIPRQEKLIIVTSDE